MTKKLKWGQTPWDNLSREELLREVQRCFWALETTRSILNVASALNPHSLYWTEGAGARALAMADQIIGPIEREYGDEVFRKYFRYAASLLFPAQHHQWFICPKCNSMVSPNDKSYEGHPCRERINRNCDGTLRALTWEDLKPLQQSAG